MVDRRSGSWGARAGLSALGNLRWAGLAAPGRDEGCWGLGVPWLVLKIPLGPMSSHWLPL